MRVHVGGVFAVCVVLVGGGFGGLVCVVSVACVHSLVMVLEVHA